MKVVYLFTLISLFASLDKIHIDKITHFVYNESEVKNVKTEQSIYPYDPELAELPFLLTGIGGSRYQSRVSRPEGYRWHQILYCAEFRKGSQ